MSSGWAVNVRANASDDFALSETYFVRVPERQRAEEAVRRHLAAPSHIIEARVPIQSSVFAALKIPDNAVVIKQE